MTMLTSGFNSGKRKKLLFAFIIILFAVGAGLFLVFSDHHKKTLTASQKSRFDQLGHSACMKNIDIVNKIDAVKIVDQDSVQLLTYRGNCYLELGKYQQAIQQYEEMTKLCEQINDANCVVSAQNDIDAANAIIKSTSVQNSTKNAGRTGATAQ
jgi:tetratricopeptide (TPR) repeat protein